MTISGGAMTRPDVDAVYEDLTRLLEDISDFLQRQIKDGALKANALQQANRLIDRSRRQIEKIEAVVPRPKEEDDYVIMNNAGNTEEDHYVQPDCIKNDLAELPAAKILKSSLKSGPLTYTRKTDRWFTFRREQHLSIFAVVYDGHFVVYKAEKRDKPWFHLDLVNFGAHAKGSAAFELTDKHKTYSFTARGEYDMEDWLRKINKQDEDLPPTPPGPNKVIRKPKKQLTPLPVPDPVRCSLEDPSDEDSTYATPGEGNTYYTVEDGVKGKGQEMAYYNVAQEGGEENDEEGKIYDVVVPAPISFVYRQNAKV